MARHWYLALTITGFAAVTALLIAVTIFALNKDIGSLFGGDTTNEPRRPTRPNSVLTPVVPRPAPEIKVYKSGTTKKPTLVVAWKNLPDDSDNIRLFRTGACGINAWELWKIINLIDAANGAVEIPIKIQEALCDFTYRSEAVAHNRQMAWGSEAVPAAEKLPDGFAMPDSTPTVSDPPPSSGSGDAQTQPPSSSSTPSSSLPTSTTNIPPSNPSPAPSSTPTQTPTSTPPVPTSTQPTPSSTTSSTVNGYPYYSPSGAIIGYGTWPTTEFWVRYVNVSYIEIGYQNLPQNSTRISVYRSVSANGPWTAILDQQNIDPRGPYLIYLQDQTVSTPHYYRLDAKNSTSTLGSYGPFLLTPGT